MAYIYQIKNKINGKIYIGKTLETIEKRWKEHCNDYLKDKTEKRPLYMAMKKYGIENFSIEIVEECLPENINEREKYWIEYFGSFKEGYNATRGGDGKHYLDYELIFKLYNENKTYKEISEILNCDFSSITKILENYNITKEARQQQNSLHNSKPVAKLDKDTLEILEVYESIKEAERKNGNSRHIASCCKGLRKTCQGFKWKYL